MRAGSDVDAPRTLARVLRGAAAPLLPRGLDGDQTPPYRGLERFDEEHAGLFFGREAEVARIMERLRAGRFAAVFGPSGSGKSSLVRAGVIPAVRAGAPALEGMRVVVVTPGAAPLAALAAATGPGGTGQSLDTAELAADERALAAGLEDGHEGPTLLVVDQLEELFTLCRDPDERLAFLRALRYAAIVPGGHVSVIVAMRADFYHRLTECPPFALLASEQGHLVCPLSREELRQAIEEPARRAGLTLAPGLAGRLIDEVDERPGSLPLLQHVLLELWRRREGRALTLEAYHESGGLEGALAKRANEVYASLSADQQALARHVLLRLTEPGEGAEDTRRRAELRELARRPDERAAIEAVVGVLAEARLVSLGRDPASGEPSAEVTHEALIRGWPRLRAWIDEERDLLRAHRRLTDATREWQAADGDEALLYRGGRLALWDERDQGALNEAERAFLAASRARAQRERSARRRRVRLAIAGLASGLVVVGAVAGIALWQRHVATDQRDAAASRRIAATASVQLATDPELALQLARVAYLRSSTPEAEQALRQATHDTNLRAIIPVNGVAPSEMSFSRDGRQLVTSTLGAGVQVWSVPDGRKLTDLGRRKGYVYSARFSEDGRRLLVLRDPYGRHGRIPDRGPGAAITIWDVARGRFVSQPTIPPGSTPVQASPQGDVLVLHSRGALRFIDWVSGQSLGKLGVGESSVGFSSVSGDGRRWVSCAGDGFLRLRSPSTGASARFSGCRPKARSFAIDEHGERVATIDSHDRLTVWGLDVRHHAMHLVASRTGPFSVDTVPLFLPDGRVVTGSANGPISIWNPQTNESVSLRGHRGASLGLAVTRDGAYLASSGDDGSVRVWDVRSATPRIVARNVISTAQSSRAVVTLGKDMILRTWTAEGRRSRRAPRPLKGPPLTALAADASGSRVAGITASGEVESIAGQASGAEPLGIMPPGHRVIAVSPDGTHIAAVGSLRIRIWGPSGRRPQLIPPDIRPFGSPGDAAAIRFSPDGRQLVVASRRIDSVVVWSLAGPQVPVKFTAGTPSTSVNMSADGRFIASGGVNGVIRVWDAHSRRVLAVLSNARGPIRTLNFNSEGHALVSSGGDGVIRVWDWTRRLELLELRRQRGAVRMASFTPDGTGVVSTGADGAFRVWKCDVCGSIKDVLSLANARAPAQLSREDRQRFLAG